LQKRNAGEYSFIFILVIITIIAAVFFALQVKKAFQTSSVDGDFGDGITILIDPGHGGKDGGASAADGTVEKDINLAISLPLYDMLRFVGYKVEITRDYDRMTCDPDLKTLREQKISDLKNRLKMYDKSRLTISIHQNHFPQSQYFGTQIWYGTKNQESKMLGVSVRQTVLEMLQPENKRELKKSTSDIYLLSRTTAPAIIVECGFLSNSDDLSKLKDEAYQKKMAYAITCGVIAYNP
jgi:N-acetylmuramoyl-L-alanine amidase